jgi:Flp pilus assembly protein TadG
MLVQMSFFILMLFGIAALTIDMGYVRLTQSLMQNAADTAALEGLRQRDAGDSTRRDSSKDMLDRAFQDPAGQRQMGAGPALTMEAPAGIDANEEAFNANQKYELGASPFFIPAVQKNQNNCVFGDMVAGAYNTGGSVTHTESADYTRDDYTPVVNGDCSSPPDPASLGSATAFLVRVRRTENPWGTPGGSYDPAARDNKPNISSSGPTLPLLFGRANVLESIGSHNPRHDGFAVRATAIANAANALQAGPAAPAYNRLGLPPFAIDKACWIALGLGSVTFTNNVITPGQLDGNVPPDCGVGSGHCIDATSVVIAIGDPPPNVSSSCAADGDAYAPVVDSTLGLVVGFGYVRAVAGLVGAFTVTPVPNQVASGNASAILHRGITSVAVAAGNADVGASTAGSLLAPALSR